MYISGRIINYSICCSLTAYNQNESDIFSPLQTVNGCVAYIIYKVCLLSDCLFLVNYMLWNCSRIGSTNCKLEVQLFDYSEKGNFWPDFELSYSDWFKD